MLAPPPVTLTVGRQSVRIDFLRIGPGYQGGGTMERYHAEGGSGVREKELKSAADLAKYASQFVPKDAEFEQAFATAKVSQAFLARYYLQALEQALRGEANPELVPNTLEKEVNLEHVLPRSPKLKDWPVFDEEAVQANIKRIGNLTLLRADDNDGAGNKAFTVKLGAFKRSKLKVNESVAAELDWTPAAIAGRQAMLAKVAVLTCPRTAWLVPGLARRREIDRLFAAAGQPAPVGQVAGRDSGKTRR